jgi:hypothetical protein
MYKDQALQTIPKFYDEQTGRRTHNLQEAKAEAIAWMKEQYTFRSYLDEKLQNVEDQQSVERLQQYLYNSAFKGSKIKWMNGRR